MSLEQVMTQRPPDEPVRVGIIGAGAYGSGIVAQSQHVPLLDVRIIAEKDLDAARKAFRAAGVADSDIVSCNSRGAAGGTACSSSRALPSIDSNCRLITDDPLLLMDLPLDVIVECTGVAEAGALHGQEAIRHGKHIVMVTKETDVTVGPILKHLADEAGVVYTAADGDQHGLATSLVSWARRIGLEVICAGKARNAEFRYDPPAGEIPLGDRAIPVPDADAWMFEPIPSGEAERYVNARREKLGSAARLGNWDVVELTILANSTGLRPDVPEMHCPTVRISEIPTVLCDRESGGILDTRGVVECVTCLRHPHDAGLAGGVFVVVDGGNDVARRVLSRASTAAGANGAPGLITRPCHLLGIETIESILTAALLGVPTAPFEYEPSYDAVIRAPRDIAAGEIIDMCSSHKDAEALMVPAKPVADGVPIPGHLCDGHAAAADIPEGSLITRDMIAAPSESALWSLRAQQDEHFLKPTR